MPRLIATTEFLPLGPLNPSFYFPDCVRDGFHSQTGADRFRYTVQSGYPTALHMHDTVLNLTAHQEVNKAGPLRIAIRRCVEENLSDDVILTHVSMDYYFLERPGLRWDGEPKFSIELEKTHVKHGYDVFNFSSLTDATFFKMRFGEHISDPSNRHPRYSWVGEDQVNRRYWD